MSDINSRTAKLLTAARQSPQFGVRLLAELPAPARAEALRRWSLPDKPEALEAGPGLKKCGTGRLAASPNNGLSAQLFAFARSVGRVG